MNCDESLQAFKETFNIFKSKILPFNKECNFKGVLKQTDFRGWYSLFVFLKHKWIGKCKISEYKFFILWQAFNEQISLETQWMIKGERKKGFMKSTVNTFI